MTTAHEHVEWAKARALAELDADPTGRGPVVALASLVSDLGKHPDTVNHPGLELLTRLAAAGHLATATDVRKHITRYR